ncbi:MAG TPA: hypothetical protein ENK52_05075 [Saprospiraceae bacterium]|nr:hypothetical protein [Saprospiraceae bacterium]
MTSKEINQSIESMKINLTKGEKIEHWVNFILMLIPLVVLGEIIMGESITDGEFPKSGIIIIIMFFLFLRHKLVSPKLDVYKSGLTEEQFKQANQAAATLNEWVILSNRKNYFSAIKGTGWQWEGIKITAILKNGKIYLNSMVNPSTRSNPFSFGLNKKNKLALIRQYQLILKGENVVESADKEIEKREEEFWEESEWNIKNALKRIIGYGLSIPFIILGIWMISSGEIKGIGIGIVLIGLCSSYIYQDIQVIRQKRKRKKKPGYNNA